MRKILFILFICFFVIIISSCDRSTVETINTDMTDDPSTENQPYSVSTESPEVQPTEEKTEVTTEPASEEDTVIPTQINTENQSYHPTETNTTAEPTNSPEPESDKTAKRLPRDKYGLPLPIPSLTEEQLALCLQPDKKRDMSYFNDSVFIGDSTAYMLKYYVSKNREKDPGFLGNAEVYGVASYGVYQALKPITDKSMHPTIKGEQILPQDLLARKHAKKAFLVFGLNDSPNFSIKSHLKYYKELIDRIKDACPDIQIVILSTTPITIEGEKKSVYSRIYDDHNIAILDNVAEWGCYYADVASVVKDSEGYLRTDYSSDNYCHMKEAAYLKIINYLLTHPVPDTIDQVEIQPEIDPTEHQTESAE